MRKMKLTLSWLVPVILLAAGLVGTATAGAQTSETKTENSSAAPSTSPQTDDVKALKNQVLLQQNQLSVQQKRIDRLQETVEKLDQLLQAMQAKQPAGTTEAGTSAPSQASARAEASRNSSPEQVSNLTSVRPAPTKAEENRATPTLAALGRSSQGNTEGASRSGQASAGGQASSSPSLGQVASLTPVIPAPTKAAENTATPPLAVLGRSSQGEAEVQKSSPLSVRIGDAEFTPLGFMDFTEVFRSTNLGSGIGTSFGSLPFSNTTAGQLTETRFSMQNSRIGLSATSKVKGFDVKGYVETDFLGNSAGTVFITSNANTLRSRLYWVQARKGSIEFLGGQSWSLLTPNRTGLSPNPSDIFYSQDMDTNYQVGLTWTRQAQFRLIYHATDTLAAGVSFENSQQYVGSATLPSKFPATEVETGSGNTATPNVLPDVIAKVAFDPSFRGLHQHVEVAGLLTSARVFDPITFTKNTAEGGGLAVNFNLEVIKNLHAVLNTFYSDGGGRYIFALGPQFVVRPNQSGALAPAMLHAYSGIAGVEYQATKAAQVYAYYGGAYFDRYISVDPATSKLIGYGYGPDPRNGGTPSPNTQNRSIQEGTLGLIQTFWKEPRFGALQLITQYSYLTRSPWAVTPLTVGPPPTFGPANAHLSMGYVDLRYVLP
ncbi:MAG TPA: hypothetical protein VKM93_17080 [Terriglobia bacterium]|nr:hypothetical protein [Terriglobia bacterium]